LIGGALRRRTDTGGLDGSVPREDSGLMTLTRVASTSVPSALETSSAVPQQLYGTAAVIGRDRDNEQAPDPNNPASRETRPGGSAIRGEQRQPDHGNDASEDWPPHIRVPGEIEGKSNEASGAQDGCPNPVSALAPPDHRTVGGESEQNRFNHLACNFPSNLDCVGSQNKRSQLRFQSSLVRLCGSSIPNRRNVARATIWVSRRCGTYVPRMLPDK